MYDAYKDALRDSLDGASGTESAKASSFAVLRAIAPNAESTDFVFQRWHRPLLTLSLVTCLSYVAHLGTIMLACFLVLLKVFPVEPVVREHAIEFLIADLSDAVTDKNNGREKAQHEIMQSHSPEKVREQVNPSSKGAEAGTRVDDLKKEAMTKETDQISSKEIITPDTKQSPVEARSLGSSDTAKVTIKSKNAQLHEQGSSSASERNLARSSQQEHAAVEQGQLASVTNAVESGGQDNNRLQNQLGKQLDSSQAYARGGMANLSALKPALTNSASSSLSVASAQVSQNTGAGIQVADPTQRPLENADIVSINGTPSRSDGLTGIQTLVSIAMVPGQQKGVPQSSRRASASTSYEGIIDDTLSADGDLSPVWKKYFQTFQNARQAYHGEMLPGRAEAELVFDSKGAPVSYNIKNASSPAADSLDAILKDLNVSAMPSLPAKHVGQLSVKVGIIHSGMHTIGTIDVSRMKTSTSNSAPQSSGQIKPSQQNNDASDAPDSRSPSMLGFMDESLSAEPAMQQFWSEYSKVLSHVVRDRSSAFSTGSTIASFAVDRNGQPLNVKMTNPQSDISRELSSMLSSAKSYSEKLPTLPTKHVGKTYMAVKLSTKNEKPFVSVEIQPNPIQLNNDSLNAFESETQLQAYLQDLKKVIYRSWNPRTKEGAKPVMVGFHIDTNGKLSNHKVVQSSGDPEADKAALDAALAVTEWVAPPAGTEEDLDISMVIQNCTPCDETKTGENAHKKRITVPSRPALTSDSAQKKFEWTY